ncbi:MAG TPA: DUF4112 domain-containing protein [Cyanobacteria bacterium UBA11369]|nr:DUF4112 domain-containing protein [Cyanobacteria bacterium UBA11371]HBE34878.1 DUF4112 domain-containing protein [Cyanobacteria bacterium UBA11368]HBE51121.1 DUF4112 domain-containing protein [Cyanobacteria bacterium UBA11369]
MSNPADESKAIVLRRLRQLTDVLDNAVAIPGTNYRVGIDPLLGLLPGGGDTLGAILSAYIVLQAAQLGAPRPTLVRMVWNILLDSLVGTIPLLGDFVDVAWKANTKNMALLEAHMRSPYNRQKTDTWFVYLLLGGVILVAIAISFTGVFILTQLFKLATGT